MFWKVEIRKPAVRSVEQIHIPHCFEDNISIFRLEYCPAADQQQLDKVIEKFEILFSRFERERIDAWPILSYTVHLAAIKLYLAFIARSNIKNIAKAVVLLLKRQHLISMH